MTGMNPNIIQILFSENQPEKKPVSDISLQIFYSPDDIPTQNDANFLSKRRTCLTYHNTQINIYS